nr:MAG TPA: Protein of unknown function (DUF1018) [Caudoviricetes sp.]
MEGNRRTTLIKMIHVARGKAMTCNCGRVSFSKVCPACGGRTQRMPEFWYRSILEAMGGADTCSMIDTAGLQRVMDVFDKAGFSNLRPGDARKRTTAQQLFVVEKEGQRLLGERWRQRLEGYVGRKYGRGGIDECSYEELRDVFGFIHRTAKYERLKAGEGDAR